MSAKNPAIIADKPDGNYWYRWHTRNHPKNGPDWAIIRISTNEFGTRLVHRADGVVYPAVSHFDIHEDDTIELVVAGDGPLDAEVAKAAGIIGHEILQ